MPIIRTILLLILVAVVSVAGLQVAANRGLIDSNPLAGLVGGIMKAADPIVHFIPPNLSNQVAILSERTNTVSQEVGTVLGSSIQVEKEELPLHQKAFQHGRYLYCQQVIRDYEAQQASRSAESDPN
jgi:hypothetical protein